MNNYAHSHIFIEPYGDISPGTRCFAEARDGMWQVTFHDDKRIEVPAQTLAYSKVLWSHSVPHSIADLGVHAGDHLLHLRDVDSGKCLMLHVGTGNQVILQASDLIHSITKPVLSVHDLLIGRYYMGVSLPFGNIEIVKCSVSSDEDSVCTKYLDQRIWATPDNPQALRRWIDLTLVQETHNLGVLSGVVKSKFGEAR